MVRSGSWHIRRRSPEAARRSCPFNLRKELQSTIQHRSNTFYTGIEMADILAHLYVDEDTLSAAMLYRAVREGVMPLAEVQEKFGEQVYSLVKGTLSMGKLSELIEKINAWKITLIITSVNICLAFTRC